MNIEYYIPIQSVNLAHYYGKGIICPADYLENRNKDLQNRFDNYLLLSTEKFTSETDCSLEVVFNEKEEKPILINGKFYLFDMPIPISRVKAIYFQSEVQKKNTVFNITSGAAFLPLDLIKVDTSSLKIETNSLNKFSPKNTHKNWQRELTIFDRILGGIAMFPISKKRDENYPINYFSVLANINSEIKKELDNQQITTTKDYSWAFESDSQFKPLHEIIFSDVDDRLLQSVAQKDNVNIKTRNGLYLFDSIPSKTNTYLASILASYGQGKRKKIDDFFSDFFSGKFETSRQEGIAFIFGINKGYSSFRSTYKTNNYQVDVKFRLDSQLDFYSIESVYQFVFNQKKKNAQFPYIDNWCPKYMNKLDTDQNSFKILDKEIFLEQAAPPSVSVLGEVSNSVIQLLKKWLPVFQPTDRNYVKKEIESTISGSIELYRTSIIDKEKENTQSIIDAKNAQIASLEEQLRLFRLDELNEESSLEGSKVAEPKTPYNKAKTSRDHDLFTQNTPNRVEESVRADMLFNLGIGKLKEIAKGHSIKNISKYSNKDKSELINKIIRAEFEKN